MQLIFQCNGLFLAEEIRYNEIVQALDYAKANERIQVVVF
jgi:hypothetical protein